jgi:hypothetical protein
MVADSDAIGLVGIAREAEEISEPRTRVRRLDTPESGIGPDHHRNSRVIPPCMLLQYNLLGPGRITPYESRSAGLRVTLFSRERDTRPPRRSGATQWPRPRRRDRMGRHHRASIAWFSSGTRRPRARAVRRGPQRALRPLPRDQRLARVARPVPCGRRSPAGVARPRTRARRRRRAPRGRQAAGDRRGRATGDGFNGGEHRQGEQHHPSRGLRGLASSSRMGGSSRQRCRNLRVSSRST